MKKTLGLLAGVSMFGLVASASAGELVQLSDSQMDGVTGGCGGICYDVNLNKNFNTVISTTSNNEFNDIVTATITATSNGTVEGDPFADASAQAEATDLAGVYNTAQTISTTSAEVLSDATYHYVYGSCGGCLYQSTTIVSASASKSFAGLGNNP